MRIEVVMKFLLLPFLGAFDRTGHRIGSAGGGFIIIPILVLIARMSMKKAVSTSLFIIAINSLIGFLGDVGHLKIEWWFLLTFTTIAIIGIFIGLWVNKFVDGKKLKKGFGWFVLTMGVYIIIKELFLI